MSRTVDQNHYLLEIALKEFSNRHESCYSLSLPCLRNFESLVFHPKVTIFVGENGSGKSTLLEAIAVALGLNPEGGSKNFNFETRASHSQLHKFLKMRKGIRLPKDSFFLRTESFFNVATEIEKLHPSLILNYGGTSLHEQSHGQSFLSLFNHRFFGKGMYMLDEPESALSAKNQLAFLARMHELTKDRSQFIIATHSPLIMGYPDAWIYRFDETGISQVEFRDTDSFAIYHQFLNSPGKLLKEILREGDN